MMDIVKTSPEAHGRHLRELCAKAHLTEVTTLVEWFLTERVSFTTNIGRLFMIDRIVKECCDLAIATGSATTVEVDPLPLGPALEKFRAAEAEVRKNYLAHAADPSRETWPDDLASSVGETAMRCARRLVSPKILDSTVRLRIERFVAVPVPSNVLAAFNISPF